MVGGVLLVMSWWRFGSVMACIIVVGLMLGFLIASTVLFTPLGRKETLKHCYTHTFISSILISVCVCPGDLDLFRRSDAVFWVTFCCIMLIAPLLFVRWPREVTDFTPEHTHHCD